MTTGFVFHELCLWHDTRNYATVFPPGLIIQPGEHAENPETKRRMRNLLEVSGLLDSLHPLKAEPVAEADLLRFHTPEHVERIGPSAPGPAAMRASSRPSAPAGSRSPALRPGAPGGCSRRC